MKLDFDHKIDQLECKIQELQMEVARQRGLRPVEEVQDYELFDWEGNRCSLSSMFGEHKRLIVVHNMGKACNYCTIWADGFMGIELHISSFASFVVTSPDPIDVQKQFAQSRGWPFRMYSADGTTFVDDMGFDDPEEGFMRVWATRVLEHTLAELRGDYERRGKADVFDALSPYLVEGAGADASAAATSEEGVGGASGAWSAASG